MKPIVHYDNSSVDPTISVGLPAFVITVDHPSEQVYSGQLAKTSRVIRYDKFTGEFETLNTIYRPAQ